MIFESKIRREPIYESVYASTRYLVEANLTQDQIKQVFQTVSDNLAGDKSNRTALGKGADVVGKGAAAVSGAWNKVKSAIASSGPVTGFDVTIDKLQGGILDKLGGKGGKVAKTLTAYREFAKKHPIMQGAVYAIFVAAAAVATGGGPLAIGAIAGGLKLADRLLQGDKASSAIWKGFKAGAIGAAAAGIAGMLQGGDTAADAAANAKAAATGSKASGAENLAGAKASGAKAAAASIKSDMLQYAVKQGDTLSDIAQRANTSVDLLLKANPQITNPDVIKAGMKISIPDVFGSVYDKGVGTAADTAAKLARGVYRENRYIDVNKTTRFRQLAESRGLEVSTVYFTQAGVNRVFENVVTEGMWDRLKGAVKSGISSATNKVTFDKLDMNWRRGGNPVEGSVDSEKIKDFLRSQGVKDDVIDAAISKLTGGAPAEPEAPGADTKTTDISPKTKRYLDALVSRIDVEPDRAAKQADVKKIVNAIRSSGDPAEFRFVIPKVVDIINQNEYDLTPDWAQKAIKAVKAGKLIERSMFRTLTGMLGEAGLTWSEVGYKPLLSESVKGYVVLKQI